MSLEYILLNFKIIYEFLKMKRNFHVVLYRKKEINLIYIIFKWNYFKINK